MNSERRWRTSALHSIPMPRELYRYLRDGDPRAIRSDPKWPVDSHEHLGAAIYRMVGKGLPDLEIVQLCFDPDVSVNAYIERKRHRGRSRGSIEREIYGKIRAAKAGKVTGNDTARVRIAATLNVLTSVSVHPARMPKGDRITDKHRLVIAALLYAAYQAGHFKNFGVNQRTLAELARVDRTVVSKAIGWAKKKGMVSVTDSATARVSTCYELNLVLIESYFLHFSYQQHCGARGTYPASPSMSTGRKSAKCSGVHKRALFAGETARLDGRILSDSAGLGPVLAQGQGVTVAVFKLLGDRLDDAVTVKQLQEATGYSNQGVRRALRHLVDIGAVVKSMEPPDPAEVLESEHKPEPPSGRRAAYYYRSDVDLDSLVESIWQRSSEPSEPGQKRVWRACQRQLRRIIRHTRERRGWRESLVRLAEKCDEDPETFDLPRDQVTGRASRKVKFRKRVISQSDDELAKAA